MFNAQNVNAKLTLEETVCGDEHTSYYFACNEQVACSGAQYNWDYTAEGDTVTVTGINVHERNCNGDIYYDVNALLAEERIVYTDEAFVEAVSDLLNMHVGYTEQGMQDYGMVSMEA